MSNYVKLIYLFVAVAVGFIFVFWPRQNLPYTGPMPYSNTCENVYINKDGVATPYPPPGVKKTGFPIVNRTVYKGGHCPIVDGETVSSTAKVIEDFLIGSLLIVVLAVVLQKAKSRS